MNSHPGSSSPALPVSAYQSHPFAQSPQQHQQQQPHYPVSEMYGAHQEMVNSQHPQQSVMFNQQNPQVIMQGMPAYMPYMVRQGAMMSAQPPPTPQQSAAIRQMTMIPRFPSPMPPYQQHPQQQQQQQQQQTGFVQQEQPHYSMMPPDSNYHLTAASMHPAYYQAMQVQQPVPQRSDGSMPGNVPPPQVYAAGGQMPQPNAQQWQMFHQQQSAMQQRYPPMVSLRFQQQPMPLQRMMPPSMPQPGMPQEMPPEVVARPPMHVAEPAQRPQFMPRPQRSDIVYYDTSKGGTDADDKASQATKPKAKCALAIIDPSTGQNVLETLEMSSRQTSNEALKIQSEFAHKVTQRISLGDKAPNVSIEKMPTQPLHGARPKNLVAAAPTAILYEDQPLEIRPEEGQTLVSAVQEVVNCAEKTTVQGISVADFGDKVVSGRIDESLSYEAAEFVPAAQRTLDAGERRPVNEEIADLQSCQEAALLDSGVESLLEEPSEVKETGNVESLVPNEGKVEENSQEKVDIKLEKSPQERTSDKLLEKIPEKLPEKISEKLHEKFSEILPEKAAEKIPEKVEEKIPERITEKLQERIPERLPEKVLEKVQEKSQERAHERIQEKVPEKAQEKMQEIPHEKIREKVQEKVQEKTQEKVQEKTQEKVQEKTQEKVQENAKEKVQEKAKEKVQEKAQEKVPEKTEEKTQGLVQVVKLPQVEREEIQRPPPVAELLVVEQSKVQVLNVSQLMVKEDKAEAPIISSAAAAEQSKEKEITQPPSEIIYSGIHLANNLGEILEKSIDSDHQPAVQKLVVVDANAELTVADVDSAVDAVVDGNSQEEEVQDELEDGEIIEPKDTTASQKPQYSYEPGQWTPVNPDGKKVYSRDFLLQLQYIPESVQTPPGLPDLPEIFRGMAPARELPREHSFSNLTNIAQYSGYDFTPRFAHDTMSMNRAPVKRGSFQKRNDPPVKVIHIRRSEDVQLHKTEQAWKPALVVKDDSDPEVIKTADLYKKMRGILNKITPSTFEKLLTQITELPIDNETRLSGCIAIIFEKALSEPKFVKEYSNLAHRMMSLSVPSTDNPSVKVTFRKLLLNRCQEEFEKDQQDERDIKQRQKEIEETTTEDQKKRLIEEKEQLVATSRRRSLGNIRFIGELFKLKMLTEKIMHDCIKKLLDAEDEDSLELLCNLLKTIGKELDTDKAKKLMDSYFVRLGDKQTSVPARIRFMIKDLLEQRKNKWVPRRAENIPKTIHEIHKEAIEEKELAKQQLLNRAPPPPKPRPDRRLPGTSSTEKIGEDGWTMAVGSNTKNRIDTTKMMQIAKSKKDTPVVLSLKPQWQMSVGGLGSRGSSQEAEKPSMPSNRFSALENLGSGRRLNESFTPQRFSEFPGISGRVSSQERSSSQELRRDNSPHGAVQRTSSPLTRPVPPMVSRKEDQPAKELSRETIEHKAESLMEEFLHVQDLREAVTCVKELESPRSLHVFVSFAINYVLEKKELARLQAGNLLHQLFTEGVLSFEQCELGFKEVLQEAESLAVDIPKVWEYLGEIVASTIKDSDKMWQLLKTGCQELAPSRRDVLFRKTVAVAAHKLGADRTSMALRRSGMRWSDFVNTDLFSYTKQNNLEQLDPVREELIALLKQHSDNQPIFEWIQRNVTPAEAETREFIRALVTAVCTRAIMASETSSNAQSASYSVSEAEIVSRQTLLQRYLDHKPDREIQALYALQALVHSLEHPSNILYSFFNILYDKEIIAEDAFWEWKNSSDPAEQNGRGVAFQSVRPFFEWLGEGTEETTGS